jgi:hypothetical protein
VTTFTDRRERLLKRRLLNAFLIVCLAGSAAWVVFSNPPRAQAGTDSVGVPTSLQKEAPDFATLALGNAWDMNEFEDISQYLNGAGRHPSLTNIQVKDGVFSATSIGDRTTMIAYFFPLFPGYPNFIPTGNVGVTHPIDPNQYQCLYAAMQVDSPSSQPQGKDGWRVFWFADEEMSQTGGTVQMDLDSANNWRLYKVDLNNPQRGLVSGSIPWNGKGAWEGLKIEPTFYKDVDFQVDWIRLTSCQNDPAYQAAISWNPDASVNTIWVRPVGTSRNILLQGNVDGSKGSTVIDTKGLAAGSYQVGLGSSSSCCAQWSSSTLNIDETPGAVFEMPSAPNTPDYAASAGNAWDMDPSDVTSVRCSQYSFDNGILKLDTNPPSLLPPSCLGAIGEAGSELVLNLPGPIKASDYRYLSFRHYIAGDYAIPADGMIGRWMWTTADNCTYVSDDIPYDVGWHTYVIDLYDSLAGTPIESGPSGCGLKPWKDAGTIIHLYFDPNENWTGNTPGIPPMVFHEEFDWIRLTKDVLVNQGSKFTIDVKLSKPSSQLKNVQYYYTTDPHSPMQSWNSIRYNGSQSQPPAIGGSHLIFLPTIQSQFDSDPTNTNFLWDTTGVTPGDYYICTQVADQVDQAAYCSQVPVKVR